MLRKAVLPAAGLGTRFLPVTKAVPKEMLPLLDRPCIEYVVAEAVEAGFTDIVLVTSRGKTAMEDYFDRPWRDLIGRVAERDGLPLRRGMRARTSTDSVVVSRMGVPTATLIAINRYKALSNYHRMTDTPENICWPTVA